MNLACAVGLPGSERVDFAGCRRVLNNWPDLVHRFTEACFGRFRKNPAKYDNSEAVFRMAYLVIALHRHGGVRYDPAKKGLGHFDPFDLDDYFIHSVIQGPGGSCGTLPVVYASVGRRLG